MGPELDIIRDIPGYKVILKAILKHQIRTLVEQLSLETDEESIFLTASITDGTLSHLGSTSGVGFLDSNEDLKSQFLGFCLKERHTQDGQKKKQSSEQSSSSSKQSASSFGPIRSNRSSISRQIKATPKVTNTLNSPARSAKNVRMEPYTVSKPSVPTPTSSNTWVEIETDDLTPRIKIEPIESDDIETSLDNNQEFAGDCGARNVDEVSNNFNIQSMTFKDITTDTHQHIKNPERNIHQSENIPSTSTEKGSSSCFEDDVEPPHPMKLEEVEDTDFELDMTGADLSNLESPAVTGSSADSQGTERYRRGRGKKGKYYHYSPKEKAQIGKYCLENGPANTARKFRSIFPYLNESSVRNMREQYKQEMVLRISTFDSEEVTEIPTKRRGRPLTLGKELDNRLKNYIVMMKNAGAIVNTSIVKSVARGVVSASDSTLLIENGGTIDLTKYWARSFLHRINFFKRKCSTAASKADKLDKFETFKSEFLEKVNAKVAESGVAKEMVINWHYIDLNFVPTSEWTLEVAGEQSVEIKGLGDKRKLTAVFAGTLLATMISGEEVFVKTTKKKFKRRLNHKTLQTKYDALMAIETGIKSRSEVRKELDIPDSTLSTWLKNRESIKEGFKQCAPGRCKVRTPNHKAVEDETLNWYRILRSKDQAVNGPMLQNMAATVARQFGIADFKASSGWLTRFKKRNSIGGSPSSKIEPDLSSYQVIDWKDSAANENVFNHFPPIDTSVAEDL